MTHFELLVDDILTIKKWDDKESKQWQVMRIASDRGSYHIKRIREPESQVRFLGMELTCANYQIDTMFFHGEILSIDRQGYFWWKEDGVWTDATLMLHREYLHLDYYSCQVCQNGIGVLKHNPETAYSWRVLSPSGDELCDGFAPDLATAKDLALSGLEKEMQLQLLGPQGILKWIAEIRGQMQAEEGNVG